MDNNYISVTNVDWREAIRNKTETVALLLNHGLLHRIRLCPGSGEDIYKAHRSFANDEVEQLFKNIR